MPRPGRAASLITVSRGSTARAASASSRSVLAAARSWRRYETRAGREQRAGDRQRHQRGAAQAAVVHPPAARPGKGALAQIKPGHGQRGGQLRAPIVAAERGDGRITDEQLREVGLGGKGTFGAAHQPAVVRIEHGDAIGRRHSNSVSGMIRSGSMPAVGQFVASSRPSRPCRPAPTAAAPSPRLSPIATWVASIGVALTSAASICAAATVCAGASGGRSTQCSATLSPGTIAMVSAMVAGSSASGQPSPRRALPSAASRSHQRRSSSPRNSKVRIIRHLSSVVRRCARAVAARRSTRFRAIACRRHRRQGRERTSGC